MYTSDEYEISDADVHEVIAWAEAEAGARTYTLYAAVHDHRGELGLVHLAGLNPTEAPWRPPSLP